MVWKIPLGGDGLKLLAVAPSFASLLLVLTATMASGDVDLCLVPESPIELHGPNGCLPHLMKRVRTALMAWCAFHLSPVLPQCVTKDCR